MGTLDPRRGWWGAQCNARGPALSHVHEKDCEEHPRGMCCECGRMEFSAPPPTPRVERVDVQARMSALGLDGDYREPGLATGRPNGTINGLGRGDLTPDQREMLRDVRAKARLRREL